MNRSWLRRSWLRQLATAIAVPLLAAGLAFAEEPPAKEASPAPDLSTPAKAAKSFFKAARTRDVVALKIIISPRIQELMAKGGKSLEDFAMIWDGQMEFISAAEPVAEEAAKERAKVPVTGKSKKTGKRETHDVTFIKSGDRWLLDER